MELECGIGHRVSTFIIGFMLGIIALGDNGIEQQWVYILKQPLCGTINSADSGLPNVPSRSHPPTDPLEYHSWLSWLY